MRIENGNVFFHYDEASRKQNGCLSIHDNGVLYNYKLVLCRSGTCRVNGEDRPALFPVSAPDNETLNKAGFEELHNGLWGKVLTDKELRKIKKGMPDDAVYEELEYVKTQLAELLQEMENSGLRGTYQGTYRSFGFNHAAGIDWKIRDNVTIVISLFASAGCDDVIEFYYTDPNGNEHRHPSSDDYPHCDIMDLLREYNDRIFEVKETGLLRKKYKLEIKKR